MNNNYKLTLIYKVFKNRELCKSFWNATFSPELSTLFKRPTFDPIAFDDWLINQNTNCKKENSIITNTNIYFNNDQDKIDMIKIIFDAV